MFASRLNSIQWEQLAMDCFSLVVGAMEGRKLNNNTRNFFSWLLTSRDYCFVLHVFIKCVFKYVKHTFAYVDDVLESKVFTQGCTLGLSFYQSAGVKKYIFKWTLFSFHADMFSLAVFSSRRLCCLLYSVIHKNCPQFLLCPNISAHGNFFSCCSSHQSANIITENKLNNDNNIHMRFRLADCS